MAQSVEDIEFERKVRDTLLQGGFKQTIDEQLMGALRSATGGKADFVNHVEREDLTTLPPAQARAVFEALQSAFRASGQYLKDAIDNINYNANNFIFTPRQQFPVKFMDRPEQISVVDALRISVEKFIAGSTHTRDFRYAIVEGAAGAGKTCLSDKLPDLVPLPKGIQHTRIFFDVGAQLVEPTCPAKASATAPTATAPTATAPTATAPTATAPTTTAPTATAPATPLPTPPATATAPATPSAATATTSEDESSGTAGYDDDLTGFEHLFKLFNNRCGDKLAVNWHRLPTRGDRLAIITCILRCFRRFYQLQDSVFFVIYLLLDEFQKVPACMRGLLRAVRYTHKRHVHVPQHPILSKTLLIPVLSGTTSALVAVSDLCDVTDYHPAKSVLRQLDSLIMRHALLETLHIPINTKTPYLNEVIDQCGGLPVCLDTIVSAYNSHASPAVQVKVSRDSAKVYLEKIHSELCARYNGEQWRITYGQDCEKLAILAAGGAQVPETFPIGNSTVGLCQKSGLISAQRVSPASNEVIVTIPPAILKVVNTEVFVPPRFDADSLNPLADGWDSFESVTGNSLLSRFLVASYLGLTTIAVRELRPGAHVAPESQQVLDIEVCIPDRSCLYIKNLGQEIFQHGGKQDLTSIIVGLATADNTVTVDMKLGLIARCCPGQTAVDVVAFFPSNVLGVRPLLWLSQCRSTSWFNKNTGDIQQTYLSGLTTVKNACVNLVQPYLSALGDPVVIVELVSDRLPKNWRKFPTDMIVISSDNWEAAMGPVFGQRGRIHRALALQARERKDQEQREKKEDYVMQVDQKQRTRVAIG